MDFNSILSQLIQVFIVFLCGMFWAKIHYISSQYTSIKEGLVALLRSEIISVHEECMTLHGISYLKKEVVNKLYKSYDNLGGNGVITGIMRDIDNLPIIYTKYENDDISKDKKDI